MTSTTGPSSDRRRLGAFTLLELIAVLVLISTVLAIIVNCRESDPVVKVTVIAAITIGCIEYVVVADIHFCEMPLVFRGMTGDDVYHGLKRVGAVGGGIRAACDFNTLDVINAYRNVVPVNATEQWIVN